MSIDMECSVCGGSRISVVTYDDAIEHGGQNLPVRGLEITACADCGSEVVTPEQARRNHTRFADARRSTEGLLTSNEIRDIRGRLGVSQAEAAKIFGGGTHGFSKYERGDVMQSISMDRLLRLVSDRPHLLNDLKALAGIDTGWQELEKRGSNVRLFPRIRVVPATDQVVANTWQPAAVARLA